MSTTISTDAINITTGTTTTGSNEYSFYYNPLISSPLYLNNKDVADCASFVTDVLSNKYNKNYEKPENKTPKKNKDEDKYTPKRIIKNGPAMVVFWKDGTKTVVKKRKGDKDNVYYAFCAALAKKIYNSNSKVNHIVGSVIDESKKNK